jgi:hypothetical protein
MTFANRLFGPVAWVMSIFVACSTFGGVNGTLLTASRSPATTCTIPPV